MAKLSHITIKCYLAAMHHLQVAEKAGDPRISQMPRLEHALWDIKLTKAKGKKKRMERLPISVEIMGKLRQ